MAKEKTSEYIYAIIGIVLIVGIVFLVQNLNFGSVQVDTTGQAYSASTSVIETPESCNTVDCGNGEYAICYADEDGNCNCPPCSQ